LKITIKRVMYRRWTLKKQRRNVKRPKII